MKKTIKNCLDWISELFLSAQKMLLLLVLDKISFKAKFNASMQMIVNVVFATLPIWVSGTLYGLDRYYRVEQTQITGKIIEGILSNISNGELLMYAAGTLGPILYLGISTIVQENRYKGWVMFQVILSVLINLLATVIFFQARGSAYVSNTSFITLTLIIYITCLLLLFPSMALEHESKSRSASDAQKEDEEEFSEEYSAHRGG